jgi:hypothetical protein
VGSEVGEAYEEMNCSSVAFPKLFRCRNAGSSCYNAQLSPRTAAPPCLPLDMKDSLKEDTGFGMKGGFLDQGRLLDKGMLFDGGFFG